MKLFKADPFGYNLFIKKWLITILGLITHQRYNKFNKLKISGSDVIRNLPQDNILFISNHQTYYADVAAMYHVFNASLHGRSDTIKNVNYIWNPKLNLYYVAAKETMRSGLLPKILSYVGAVPIERTWRKNGRDISRSVNYDDIEKIGSALEDGWLITFPQGTVEPWYPVRKGAAHIVKQYRPLVVPVVIDGFSQAFDKKGIRIKAKKVTQSMVIKYPLDIDYENDSIEDIREKMEYAIEQHPSFRK